MQFEKDFKIFLFIQSHWTSEKDKLDMLEKRQF